MKNYLYYSEEDFIMDPDFRQWVRNPDAESEVFWNQFLLDHPHKKTDMDGAKAILNSIIFKKNLLPYEKEAIWEQVQASIQKQNEGKLVSMRSGGIFSAKRLRYASVGFLATCTVVLFVYFFTAKKPEQQVVTQYGEIRKVTLPDGSLVTLNARSTITYPQHWSTKNEREVWVDGEAFFSVKHTLNNQRFIVHTNELDIEVLGTEFNVRRRDDNLKVSLNSGKIKLKMHESPEALYMIPGEILEVAAKKASKRSGKVEDLSVWKDNKLVFDDTPLSEIIVQLKYIYGWEFTNIGQDLLDEKLTGEVETTNEHKLINTLEKAVRIKIDKKGKTINISRL